MVLRKTKRMEHDKLILNSHNKAKTTRDIVNRECRRNRKRIETLLLLLTSQYMLSLLMFVVQNKNLFQTKNENHNLDTRQRNSLYLPQANLKIYQKGAYYSGIKIFNNITLESKNVAGNHKNI